MEGYLTLPFAKGTIETSKRIYPDEDPDPHYTAFRDWKGGKDTYNSHSGTDFYAPPGTKVRAAAPGKVMYIDWTKDNAAVSVLHFDGRWTTYAHLGTVEIEYSRGKNPIIRGAVIGTSARRDFHFGFSDKKGYIDPYRDLLNPSAISWWTKDNDPQYPF
jgi:murein DD-endopeptidase MepM/ murein hydrolase activator NlpD